ncbi:hypothetical protein [Microseira sp. BLCC-F43]|jgi:hypothetical protein|uniref:hypothetical protein n=1 Tax=Microseira sp. BLCC-F43 TaxID=3153602 RepID=UPI0035BA3BD1
MNIAHHIEGGPSLFPDEIALIFNWNLGEVESAKGIQVGVEIIGEEKNSGSAFGKLTRMTEDERSLTKAHLS